MSEYQLPEDLSQWPKDPYRLLGVTRGIGPRDLKRAYTRLIRTFKPEQFPEHFRRIREAYETVLRFVEIFGAMDIAPSEEAPPAKLQATPDQAPPDQVAPDQAAPKEETNESVDVPMLRHGIFGDDPPPEPIHFPRMELDKPAQQAPAPHGDDPAALWQLAVYGDDAEAYRRLRELDQRQPGRTEICLALYWLVVLNPQLDPQRTPADWLVHGLQANGLSGPLRELYRREVADDPNEGTSARCGRLLDLELAAPAVADLIEWRWQAAGRLGHWWIIAEDLERLRPKLLRDDEEIWARLLFSAVEQLTAMQDPKATLLIRQTLDEVKQFEHLQSRLADALDRHEFLLEVSRGLQVLRQELREDVETQALLMETRRYLGEPEPIQPKQAEIPLALLELIPLSWTRPFPEVRPLLLHFLNDVARQPWTFLRAFDHVQAQSSAVLGQFGNLLLMLRDTMPDVEEQRTGDELTSPIRQFLTSKDWDTYASFRGELLGFCLREVVAPELVAEAVAAQGDTQLAQRIVEDWPLRYVWLSYRLFWA